MPGKGVCLERGCAMRGGVPGEGVCLERGCAWLAEGVGSVPGKFW